MPIVRVIIVFVVGTFLVISGRAHADAATERPASIAEVVVDDPGIDGVWTLVTDTDLRSLGVDIPRSDDPLASGAWTRSWTRNNAGVSVTVLATPDTTTAVSIADDFPPSGWVSAGATARLGAQSAETTDGVIMVLARTGRFVVSVQGTGNVSVGDLETALGGQIDQVRLFEREGALASESDAGAMDVSAEFVVSLLPLLSALVVGAAAGFLANLVFRRHLVNPWSIGTALALVAWAGLVYGMMTSLVEPNPMAYRIGATAPAVAIVAGLGFALARQRRQKLEGVEPTTVLDRGPQTPGPVQDGPGGDGLASSESASRSESRPPAPPSAVGEISGDPWA